MTNWFTILLAVVSLKQALSSPTLWYQHTKLHKSLYGPCFYVGTQCAAANTVCRILPPAFSSDHQSDVSAGQDATSFLHSQRLKRAAADTPAVDSAKPVKARSAYGDTGGSSYGSSDYGVQSQPEYKYFDSRTDVQDQRTYELPITVNTYSEQKKVVKKNQFNLYRQHEHEHLNTNVQTNVYKTDHPHVLTEYVTYVQDKYQPIRYIHVKKNEIVQDKGVKETPTEEVVRKTVQLPPEILPVETVQIGYDGQPLPAGASALVAVPPPAADAAPLTAAASTVTLTQKTGLDSYSPSASEQTVSTATAPNQAAPESMTAVNPQNQSRWTRRKRAFHETQNAVIEKREQTVHKPEMHAMCMCAESFTPADSGLGCECPQNQHVVDGRCI